MNLSRFTKNLSSVNTQTKEAKKPKKLEEKDSITDFSNELSPNRTQTELESKVQAGKQKVQAEQNYNLVQRGEFTAREYTRADGTKIYTQAPQVQQSQVNTTPPSVVTNNIVTDKPAEPVNDTVGDENILTTGDFSTDEIRNQMNQPYAEANAGAEFFGVDGQLNITQDKKDFIQRTVQLRNDTYNFNIEALALMGEEEIRKMEKYRQQVEGAIGANRANLAQSREGVQAKSNAQVMNSYETQIKKDLEAKYKSFARSQEELVLKQREYELAKEQGDTEIALQLGAELERAQENLYLAETRMLDSNQRWVEQMLAVGQETRQQLNTFTGLIANGQQFDQQGLMNMASTLGLPTDVVMSTYQSYEQVRNDKSLDEQQKALQLGEIARDFNMRANGYMTEQQQSASILIDKYKSGEINREFLETQMTALGINDPRYNPFAKLEMEQAQLDLNIAKKQANGQPITFQDRIAMADFQLQQLELNGELMGYQPTESLAGINMYYENGEMQLDISKLEKDEFQCGEFVNRTWGLASGGSGGFADSYESKVNMIDIPADSVNEFNIIQTVRPGMAFVMPAGGDVAKYGHVGIVSKVYPDGTFDTIEANAPGDTITGNIVTKRRSLADVDGFTKPPAGKAEPVGGQKAMAVESNQQIVNNASIFGNFDGKKVPDVWSGTPAEFKSAYQQYQSLKQDPNADTVTKVRLSEGGKDVTGPQEESLSAFANAAIGINKLQDRLDQVTSDSMAPIFGAIQSNNPWDDVAVEINALVEGLVPGIARGVYGEVGVLTDADIARYKKLLPTLSNTEDQRKALINMMKESLYDGADTRLRSLASANRDVSGYAYLLEDLKVEDIQPLTADNDPLDYYNSMFDAEVEESFTNEAQSIWDSF